MAAATAACGAEPEPPAECATPFECGVSEPRPRVEHAPPRFRFVSVRVDGLSTSAGVDVNDRGELLGDGQFWRGDRHVTTAFRFTEAGGLQPIEAVGGVIPHAIANDGTIAGGVSRPNGEQAVLVRGTAVTSIGDEATYLETQGYAINDAGQVAGNCLRLDDRIPYACRYTPGSGWQEIVPGGVFAMADDGTVVGITNTESNSFLAAPGEEPIEIGVRTRLDTYPYGISPNGRYVVGMFLWPSIGPGSLGSGVVIDREHAGAPVFIPDTDDQHARDLHVQPFDVNDDGFAVGNGIDERARPIGFLFDPRQGRSFPLDQLVETDGEPVWISDARAISDEGHIAVTHLVDENGALNAHAGLLVPIDWPTRASAPTRVADDGARYDVVAVPDAEEGHGTFGVGLAGDGRVLVNVPEYMEEYRHETVRPVWFDASSETLTPLGEVLGLPGLPRRVGRSGRAVGTGVVLDDLVERYSYHAFLWAADDGPVDAGLPEGDSASFGIDVDATGRVFAECFGPEGHYACRSALDGTWTALFEGRAFAASEDGVLVGADDDDALIWDRQVVRLGLGAGARALAISDDGAFVAGVHGHAFVMDVARDVVDWLPDALGATATRGRVLPHAVNADGIVVGQAIDGEGRPFAFRYDPARGTLVDLESRFESAGIELHEAVDIDDRGRIVANGYDAEGTPRAYLLLPR